MISAWLLLLFTVICALITYQALCWRSSIRTTPLALIAKLFGGKQWPADVRQVSVSKPWNADPYQHYAQHVTGKVCLLLVMLTMMMVYFCARAFM